MVKKLIKVCLPLIVIGIALSPKDAFPNAATAPITAVSGVFACPTCATAGSSLTSNAVVIGSGSQGLQTITASTTTTEALFATAGAPAFRAIVTGDLPSAVVLEGDIGSGLAVSGGTVNTASTEAGFLTDGGTSDLTCSTSNQGKAQVMDAKPFQYCDGATSSALRYAAFGASDGDASTSRALESASTTVDVSAATAPSGGQVLTATDSTHATWQSPGTGANSIITFASETQIDSSGDTTLYLGADGRLSATEADVRVPISAATITNLRCIPTGTVGGTSLVVTAGVGACTGALTYTGGKPSVTPSTSLTTVSDTSNSLTSTAGQCVALKLAITGDINAIYLNCSADRTANS